MPTEVTCSKECRNILNTSRKTFVTCDSCGHSFSKKPGRSKSKRHFCSESCHKVGRAVVFSRHDAAWMSFVGFYDHEIAVLFGCSRAWVTKALNDLGMLGRRSKVDDLALRLRISKANTGKRTGNQNHRYKGTSEFKALGRGLFNAISRLVRAQRNYTCEYCGKRGGNQHVHHIKSFAQIIDEFLEKNPQVTNEEFSKLIINYPDFIDKDNLLLLCEPCHKLLFHNRQS